MKKSPFVKSILWVLCCTFITTVSFAQMTTFSESYENIDEIKLNIGSGDLQLVKSTSDAVEVMIEYDRSNLELKVEIDKGALKIDEKTKKGQDWGRTNWTVKIPDHKKMTFNLGAGDVEMQGINTQMEANVGAGGFALEEVSGQIKLNTGTGKIQIEKSEGTFEVNSGTGNIRLRKVSGAIVANTGTGNVMAEAITITGKSSLNSGTGRVDMSAGNPIQADLGLNSGTNDSSLDLNGFDFAGTLTMVCDKRQGKIKAPFSFSQEESEQHHRSETLKKVKRFGDAKVDIQIGSGTGTASVDQ